MNIAEILKQACELQAIAAKRGLEYIYAVGTKWRFLEWPDAIRFYPDKVEMTFEEDTRHDSPDREGVSLTIAELSMSDSDWREYIDRLIEIRENKRANEQIRKEREDRERKLKQLEVLKKELGEA